MIFVAPSGDDSGPGTFERPFATLERARDAATPGSVVTLRAGTYHLTRTFELTAEHSGVVYQAHGYGTPEQEEVVVSGGRPVTGWSRELDGTYRTELSGPAPRQLYAAGRRVERASIELELELTRTADGYTVDGDGPQSWGGDVELVYRGAYPWSEPRCPVAGISGDARRTTIRMAQPAFDRMGRLYHSVIRWEGPEAGEYRGVDSPTHVENSPAFLTDGTFATAGPVLHYRPRPGEAPEEVEVVAPALSTLLHARGAHDVTFRGITFADATWLGPNAPEGFLHYHGNGYADGDEFEIVTFADGAGQVTVPTASASIPGNVVVEDCARVTLEGCRLTRMGGVALELRGAGAENVVRDCEITEVAGGGLAIEGAGHGHHVENTHLHHIGFDYRGSPAILVSGTTGCVLAHNEVDDVPHVGIVVNESRGTRVVNNLVHHTMRVLADGGGIYVSGPQGDSHTNGAVVSGNIVRDTITPYNFGLYTDYGASWVTVRGNAVYRADTPVILTVWPPLENVTYRDNVWDADPGEAPEGVTLADNTTLPREGIDDDPRVTAIATGAGPRPDPGV